MDGWIIDTVIIVYEKRYETKWKVGRDSTVILNASAMHPQPYTLSSFFCSQNSL